MKETPLVSILLLSMNHERYIEQCVNSILSQTYKNIEINYLDNASSDNTFILGKRLLQASGKPYKAFQNVHSNGISKNLNFLISKSSGGFLIIISTDDWWDRCNVEIKLKFLIENPQYGMVYGDGFFYYTNDTTSLFSEQDSLYSGQILNELLIYNFIKAPSVMLNKIAIDKIGLFDEDLLIEDWDLWIRIAEKFPIGFIKAPLVFYRYSHGGNLSSKQEFIVSAVKQMINKYSGKYPVEMRLLTKRNVLREAFYKSTKPFRIKDFFWLVKNTQLNLSYGKVLIKYLLFPRAGQ